MVLRYIFGMYLSNDPNDYCQKLESKYSYLIVLFCESISFQSSVDCAQGSLKHHKMLILLLQDYAFLITAP